MMSNATNVNVIINQSEFEFLNSDSYLTEEDLQWMLENRPRFEKFVNDAIRNIRFGMLNLQFKSKEDITTQIDTLLQFREWLSKTVLNYKQYKADLEKEEEPTQKTIEEKEQYEALLQTKKKYHI